MQVVELIDVCFVLIDGVYKFLGFQTLRGHAVQFFITMRSDVLSSTMHEKWSRNKNMHLYAKEV